METIKLWVFCSLAVAIGYGLLFLIDDAADYLGLNPHILSLNGWLVVMLLSIGITIALIMSIGSTVGVPLGGPYTLQIIGAIVVFLIGASVFFYSSYAMHVLKPLSP